MITHKPIRREQHTDFNKLLYRAMTAISVSLGVVWVAKAAPIPSPIIQIDLSTPFSTHAPWRLLASQDPPRSETINLGPSNGNMENIIPGLIHLCLQASPTAQCDPELVTMPQPPKPFTPDEWAAHYLIRKDVVYPHGRAAPPLLLLQTGSEHSGDGDQAIFTQVLRYDGPRDHFKKIYGHVTGHNENQEDRFITAGPLQGSMISVEPTPNAPFGYWVTVSKLTPEWTYKQVLRYRSATHYNDGNELSVIDSEMPNIQQRLGLWRPGMPLPVPTSGKCEKPQMIHHALWCSSNPH